jgi:hypothetical protein
MLYFTVVIEGGIRSLLQIAYVHGQPTLYIYIYKLFCIVYYIVYRIKFN